MLEILVIAVPLIIYLLWKPYILRTHKYGAPYVPTSYETLDIAMGMLDIKKGEIFYELGSGDGRAVIAAALRGAKAYGIEIDLLRVLYSRLNIFLLGLMKNAKILHKNFFDVDLSEADCVFVFMTPNTNTKVDTKLKKELKQGARIISIGFPLYSWKPIKTDISGPVYLYETN